MSDSNGFVYDPEGIDLDLVKDIKEVRRGRIKEYVEKRPNATYTPNARPWTVACDIALPCATQNELDLEDAKALVANKVFAVCEGANMPTTPEAIHYLMKMVYSMLQVKQAMPEVLHVQVLKCHKMLNTYLGQQKKLIKSLKISWLIFLKLVVILLKNMVMKKNM